MNHSLAKMTIGKWLFMAIACLVIGAILGAVIAGSALSRRSDELLIEADVLSRIARDGMRNKATPQRLFERVKAEIDSRAEFGMPSGNDPYYVVVTRGHRNLLGMGSRWILFVEVDEKGKCRQSWLELQPQGYP